MAGLRLDRTVSYRAETPDIEKEEEEKETLVESGGGETTSDGVRGGPDREAAAKRIADRDERRRAEAQDRQERDALRREAEEGRRFRQEHEPELKLLKRLRVSDGGGEKPRPARPDPYDPDFQAKMDAYEEYLVERASERAEQRARTTLTTEQQRQKAGELEAKRTRANNDLVVTFFTHEDRRGWDQNKRDQLLYFARTRVQPSGEYGNFTADDLELAEERIFREEIIARAKAEEAEKLMGHLGARKPTARRSPDGKRNEADLDAQVEDWFLKNMDGKTHKAQERALSRLRTEDPQAHAYYVKTLDSIKGDDDEDDE